MLLAHSTTPHGDCLLQEMGDSSSSGVSSAASSRSAGSSRSASPSPSPSPTPSPSAASAAVLTKRAVGCASNADADGGYDDSAEPDHDHFLEHEPHGIHGVLRLGETYTPRLRYDMCLKQAGRICTLFVELKKGVPAMYRG